MKKSFVVLVVLGVLCVLQPMGARADDYVAATWPNLLQTMIRFKALNMSDNLIVDDYARVTDCDIYKHFYGDDFQWNKVRGVIRDSIQMNTESFPTSYNVIAPIDLDRYDFDRHAYLFTDATAIKAVNVFLLLKAPKFPCGADFNNTLPRYYRAVLENPITLTGMAIPQKDGEALLERLKAAANTRREIYARFNLTIVFVQPWQKGPDGTYSQTKQLDHASVRMDARLDSVDFFEDQALTQLIEQSKF